MRLADYEEMLVNTTRRDWTWITCWGAFSAPSYYNKFTVWTTSGDQFQNIEIDSHGEFASLKADLAVSFAYGLRHNDDFKEAWANNFSDPHASSGFIDFFCSGVLVYRDIYVHVDGARCMLPLPRLGTPMSADSGSPPLYVARRRLAFFRMIEEGNSMFESYLRRSGITVIDEAWMA